MTFLDDQKLGSLVERLEQRDPAAETEFYQAMEPFVRRDMSPEAKEANLYWIGGLWQQYLETVSRRRGIPLEDLSRAINGMADGLDAADGDFARFALDLGLVDQLISRPEAQLALAGMGAPGDGSEGYRQVEFDHYLDLSAIKDRKSSKHKIAVVVAEGDIVRGEQPRPRGLQRRVDRVRDALGLQAVQRGEQRGAHRDGGHRRPRAVFGDEVPLGDELFVRVDDQSTGHTEIGGESTTRRQPPTGLQLSGPHRVA